MAATARPLLPFDVWPPGITQAATPANDNALRAEVIAKKALSFEAAQPGSPADRDLYILSAAWGDEVTGTLAIYVEGTWHYWVPFEGLIKEVGNDVYKYSGSTWISYAPGNAAAAAVQYTADTGSTADSDPGAGLLKWNNATQASATVIYVDDATADGVDLTTLYGALVPDGFLYLQDADDQDTWQIWQVTAVTDAVGYTKIGVSLLANGGSFADGADMLVSFDQGASGDVAGPSSATDNRVATFDGVTGKLIKDSGVLISELAPKASPAFTGNPTAPTPAGGDSDTSIATTAFVQGEGFAKVQVDTFAVSGTWTKPSWAKFVHVNAQSAGAGGGSGRKGAAGSVRCGGGAGAGGARAIYTFRASDLSATETVTIGAGGPGGPAVSANDTNGNAGTNGGATSFGTRLLAVATVAGNGGTNASGTGGTGAGLGSTALTAPGATGGSASATGAAGAAGSNASLSGGGGGGGGISAADATSSGGQGGRPTSPNYTLTPGSAGAAATNGGNGATDTPTNSGSGGGGGGSSTSGSNAGNGGNGGIGAGGGGGGAGLNGTNNSGAGGIGGDGYCTVTSYG